jgi:uncharacterized membrane protein
MSNTALAWLAVLGTVAPLAAFELVMLWWRRAKPGRFARPVHAELREQWFAAVSAHEGSEILAVQTLRNSLMSATMLASTSALGLMGAVTLAAPALQAGALETVSPRLALELALLALLFGSLVSAVMAVRLFNHAGFVAGFPVKAPARQRWEPAGRAYVRRAGVLYSMGLRHLVLVVPVVAALVAPLAGPVAALAVIGVLVSIDRFAAPTDDLQRLRS